MTKEKRSKLVFSALPYVNNLPHLGNIVGCVLSSDVYSRFCKKLGQNVLHICGTDEYGTAIEMAAIESKKHPKEICDTNHGLHKKIYDWFEIEFDYFGRTTKRDHALNTSEIFQKIDSSGYLEVQETAQFYCETCSIFLADRYINGTCPKCKSFGAKGDQCDVCGKIFKPTELVDPLCLHCSKIPALRSTKHVFLRLDLLKKHLDEFAKGRMQRWSHNAQEITKEWINKDLHPRCITRDLKFRWGIPVPKKGFEDKVLYVWFDAPIGYISFTKSLLQDRYKTFVKSCEIYQFMGKDNVPFHSIFFPGICLAADLGFLVNVISSTEYLLFDSKKFSKSNKVGVFGHDMLDGRYGEASLWRYYLMKIRPESKDSNFTFQDFRSSVTGDLVHNIGNFCNRVLKYISKRLSRKISYSINKSDLKFIEKVDEIYLRYLLQMEKVELKHSIKLILDVSDIGNEYIQSTIKLSKEVRDSSFCVGASLVLYLAHMLEPFMPSVSKKTFKMLLMDPGKYPGRFQLIECGHTISSEIEPLFRDFTSDASESRGK